MGTTIFSYSERVKILDLLEENFSSNKYQFETINYNVLLKQCTIFSQQGELKQSGYKEF
jgi:hypothetical protein